MMVCFVILLSHMFTILLGVYIFIQYKVSVKVFLTLLVIAQLIGQLLFQLWGPNAIFPVTLIYILGVRMKPGKIVGNLIATAFVLIFFVLSNFVIQYMFATPLALLKTEESFLLSVTFTANLLTLVLVYLGRKVYDKWQLNHVVKKRYGLLLAAFASITVVIFYLNIFINSHQEATDSVLRANTLLLFVYTVLLLGVFLLLVRVDSKNLQMENERIQSAQLREYTEALEKHYDEMRKFRHDYINMLLTMTDYLAEKDMEGLTAYFSDKIGPIGKAFESNNYKLSLLSNLKIQELKGVVASKLITAQNLGIQTVVDISDPVEDLPTDCMKICRALGIILDNALDEGQLCQDPIIYLAFVVEEKKTVIILKNSCRTDMPPVHKLYEKEFTTKENGEGLGLINLKEIVASCENVTLATTIEDGYFTQEIGILK